jgi:hypothetical protein
MLLPSPPVLSLGQPCSNPSLDSFSPSSAKICTPNSDMGEVTHCSPVWQLSSAFRFRYGFGTKARISGRGALPFLPQTCVLHPPFHLESSTLLQCLEHTLFDYKWCIPKYAYTWVLHSSVHRNSHPNVNTAFSRQSVQLAQELFLPNEDLFEQYIKLWYIFLED